MNNPEKYAVVDPTNQRSAAASDQSWDEVKSLTSPGSKGYVKDDRPLGQPSSTSSSSAPKPVKRPAAKDKGEARMKLDVDPQVKDEIRALETRLAALKQQMGPQDGEDEL